MFLNVEDLDFAYGTDEIFKKADFRIEKGERVGLVGRNGTGKSTFIKLLTGELERDDGEIKFSSDISVGYLEQNPSFDQETPLSELFLSVFDDVRKKEARMAELTRLIPNASGKKQERLLKEYGNLQDYFLDNDAYGYESQIRGLAAGMGFSQEDLAKRFSSLSGGEKTRVLLGMQLLRKPDLLLLDEPTNYLDISALTWLEGVLTNYPGSFILVSHDRYFLDRVCTRIVEINELKFDSYNGNYTEYLRRKEKKMADEDARYARKLREINRQKAIIERYRNIDSKHSSKHARSREIALSKMEPAVKRQNAKEAHFNFEPKIRSGDEVLSVTNLSKSFGERILFNNVNFNIERTDKIGIIGPNGIGKTTLFNIIRKIESKDSGLINLGVKVRPGWFDQETRDLEPYAEMNLIETIRGEDALMDDGEARSILAAFLFTGEDVFKKVSELSGGEKARMKLAKLMLSEANFLLMDEPTNHIDMPTREILENALEAYKGTLLFISHDRYFINKVANKIFELTPEGIKTYYGNYDDYLKRKSEENEDAERLAALEKEPAPAMTKTQRNLLKKKKKERENQIRTLRKDIRILENRLEDLQGEIKGMETEMALPEFYERNPDPVGYMGEYNKKKERMDEMMEEWEIKSLELEELNTQAKT